MEVSGEFDTALLSPAFPFSGTSFLVASGLAASATKPVQKAQSPKQIEATATNIAASSAPIGSDVVENAKRVIRGDFGNGQERKDKLGAAYSEIQRKVNEMYRQGHVY